MSNPLDFTRGRIALIGIAICLVFAAIPIGIAQAAPVNLATAQPFVVLSGAGVTNTGPSVLNGDLGVSPGTSLSGFGGTGDRQRRHPCQRRRRRPGAGRPDHRLQRRRRPGDLPRQRTHRAEPRRAHPHPRRLRLQQLGGTHRPADPRRAGRSQRPVRLRHRHHADHRIGELGHPHQRRLALQRLLESRQLGDLRIGHRVRGQRPRPGNDLDDQRRHLPRPRPRPQRRSDAGQRRADRPAVLHRPGTPTGTRDRNRRRRNHHDARSDHAGGTSPTTR